MLRPCLCALFPLVSLLLLAPDANAADAGGDSVKVISMSAGDGFVIPELAAMIVREGKDLKVQLVPPPNHRTEKYKSVDLRADDLVLLANGKRVKTVAELEQAHRATAIGSEIKLGIQRGQEMMIVSFTKANPEDLPKAQVRLVTRGGEEGMEVLPAVGVMLEEKNKRVVIREVLPLENTAVKSLDVKAGDVITMLNGTRISSLKNFISAYDKLDVGAKVEWKTERKGKQIELSFAKPRPMGRVMMRKETK